MGKLGDLHIIPGHYVYVGSAFGPGGLKARLAHHLKITQRPHWHIDYLRKVVEVECVYFNASGERLEDQWAQKLFTLPGAEIPLMGFGASDSQSASHLFFFAERPELSCFDAKKRVIKSIFASHPP